jgi:hypothetical protein
VFWDSFFWKNLVVEGWLFQEMYFGYDNGGVMYLGGGILMWAGAFDCGSLVSFRWKSGSTIIYHPGKNWAPVKRAASRTLTAQPLTPP